MGLTPKSAGGSVSAYLGISKGCFVQKVDASVPGAVPRTNKMGNTVHELWFDSAFTGRIIGLTMEPNNFNQEEEIKITLEDSDMLRWVIQFPFSSTYGRQFLSRFWTMDPLKDVTIEPYYFMPKPSAQEPNPKYKSGFRLFQDAKVLEPWFTEENLGSVPPLVDIIFQGKPAKDDTARRQYMKYIVGLWAKENLPEIAPAPAAYARPAQAAPVAQPQPVQPAPVAQYAAPVAATYAAPVPQAAPMPAATTQRPAAFAQSVAPQQAAPAHTAPARPAASYPATTRTVMQDASAFDGFTGEGGEDDFPF